MTADSLTRWSLVVPVKRLAVAKTRLALPDLARIRLALAMALDTVEAALMCSRTARVVVVTDEAVAAAQLRALGAQVVGDEPDAGLDAALLHGARVAMRSRPGDGVAALAADLPSLHAGDLGTALDAAAAHAVAMVTDAAGTGTTLLTARSGVTLPVAYGAGSRDRHVAAGAVPLDLPVASLRRDVDTLADLADAAVHGLGRRTAEVVADLDLLRTPSR